MWNPEKHKLKMKPSVDKLVNLLKTKGIEFEPEDGVLNNVIFKNDKKTIKISHHSFYRYSGIATVYKENKEKNTTETVDVTDEMYINNFIKPIIELMFK